MRRILAFFVLICMLFAFCACSPAEDDRPESELSVFELKLSDEMKQQINTAWEDSAYAAESYLSPPGGILWDCIEDGKIYESLAGARYLGTYGNSVVWWDGGFETDGSIGYTDFKLAESHFYYNGFCNFYVYNDGKIYEIREAYNNKLLTDADIALIADRHTVYARDFNNRRFSMNEEGLSVFELYLPEQMKRDIGRRIVANGYAEEAVWAEYKDGTILSDGIRYYGKQNSAAMVFFVPYESGDPMDIWLGPAHIKHPVQGKLLVYSLDNGYMYDLFDDYSESHYLYNNQFVSLMEQRHREISDILYPELYN